MSANLIALAAMIVAPAASALPSVTLHAGFSPDRAGMSTTVHFGFTISEVAPLRSVVLRLPRGMGFAGSSLGLEACSSQRLDELGPEGCPADSLLGAGTAQAEVLAETTVHETAAVTAIDGPETGSQMSVLFFVDGRSPVNREAILPGALTLASSESRSATLAIEVPLLSAWPEGLTYYRILDGRRTAYEPRGLSVPERCPPAGFVLSARFRWWGLDGTAAASARIPCPAPARDRRGEPLSAG